jgi:hypothetical protein
LFDVFSLSALVSATEQQHDRRTDLAEIDSVAWSVIDPELLNPITHTVTVSEVPQPYSIQPHSNLGSGLDIAQRGKPFAKRRQTILRHIDLEFFGVVSIGSIVAYKLLHDKR